MFFAVEIKEKIVDHQTRNSCIQLAWRSWDCAFETTYGVKCCASVPWEHSFILSLSAKMLKLLSLLDACPRQPTVIGSRSNHAFMNTWSTSSILQTSSYITLFLHVWKCKSSRRKTNRKLFPAPRSFHSQLPVSNPGNNHNTFCFQAPLQNWRLLLLFLTHALLLPIPWLQ